MSCIHSQRYWASQQQDWWLSLSSRTVSLKHVRTFDVLVTHTNTDVRITMPSRLHNERALLF